jgi:hypothetical protein
MNIQTIGSVMYLMNTRLGTYFSLNKYLVEPRRVHIVATKHMMRYLKGTLDFGLHYTKDHDLRLSGYTDSY